MIPRWRGAGHPTASTGYFSACPHVPNWVLKNRVSLVTDLPREHHRSGNTSSRESFLPLSGSSRMRRYSANSSAPTASSSSPISSSISVGRGRAGTATYPPADCQSPKAIDPAAPRGSPISGFCHGTLLPPTTKVTYRKVCQHRWTGMPMQVGTMRRSSRGLEIPHNQSSKDPTNGSVSDGPG